MDALKGAKKRSDGQPVHKVSKTQRQVGQRSLNPAGGRQDLKFGFVKHLFGSSNKQRQGEIDSLPEIDVETPGETMSLRAYVMWNRSESTSIGGSCLHVDRSLL